MARVRPSSVAHALRTRGEARWSALGGVAAGTAAGSELTSRTSSDPRSKRRSHAVAAGVTGAAAGQAAYQAPAYAHGAITERTKPKYMKHGVKQSELPPEQKKLRRQHMSEHVAWKKEAREKGLSPATAHRIYPRSWPHARAERLMGWTHAGHTGHLAGATMTAAGAALAVHHANRKSTVVKAIHPISGGKEVGRQLQRGFREGTKMRHGASRGTGMVAGSAFSTPTRAAFTSGAGGALVATGAARHVQNRRLRREHLYHRGAANVGKAGDWKTIDQREELRGRAKRRQRHGEDAIGLGVGTALLAARHGRANGRKAFKEAKEIARPNPLIRHLPKRERPRAIAQGIGIKSRTRTHGAVALGGATVAAGGAATSALGRGQQAYHQQRINSRRRDNHARSQAVTASKAGNGGSFDTGPSTPVRGMTKQKSRRGTTSRFGNGSLRGCSDKNIAKSWEGKTVPPLIAFGGGVSAERLKQKVKAKRAAKVGKAVMWTPTPVLSRAQPIAPAAPVGPAAAPVSSAEGGQMKPGMLIPASQKPMANAAGRAAGGQKSGSIPASGKVKPAVAQGSVGSTAAAQPMKGVGKAFKPDFDWRDELPEGGAYQERKTSAPAAPATPVKVSSGHTTSKRGGYGYVDPESRRQRRLGVGQASTGLAGGASAGVGGKLIYDAARSNKVVPKAAKRTGTTEGLKGVTALHNKGAALVGAGAVGLAASEKIRRHANDRGRSWNN